MKTSDRALQPLLDAVAAYFAVLAEPTRLRVLHALCAGERSVGRIVEETAISQPTVSRHLAALHRHGIAMRRRDANVVYYQIADAKTRELCRAVCGRVAGAIVGRSQWHKHAGTAFASKRRDRRAAAR